MRLARCIAVVAWLLFGVVPVYAAGIPPQIPAPVYPAWGCTGSCVSQYGVWTLTAGSSLTTNIASSYSPDVVFVNVSGLVVSAPGVNVDLSVDGIDQPTGANGTYSWSFPTPNPYHIITVYASYPTQINVLVSEQPGQTSTGAGTPTSTPIPTNTPFPVQGATSTPTPTSTPCVVDAWGCDAPATATYVACETGITVNYGLDPCGPTATPAGTNSPTPATTNTPGPQDTPCGSGIQFYNCLMYGGSGATAPFHYAYNGTITAYGCTNNAPNAVQVGTDASFVSYCYQDTFTTSAGSLCYTAQGYNGGGATFKVITVDRTLGSTVGTFTNTDFNGSSQCFTITGAHLLRIEFQGNGTIDGWTIAFTPTSPTVTPTGTAAATGTATPGPTWTPRPTATATPKASPTIPPPGFIQPTATLIANIDSCLSLASCQVQVTPIAGVATGIPGAIATLFPIDTGPLSPLAHLSVGRDACTSFGKLPILVPNVTAVPGGSGTPTTLNYNWSVITTTVTISGTVWDTSQFQPCADPMIPTWVWDMSWFASIVVAYGVFIAWQYGYIRRLFA